MAQLRKVIEMANPAKGKKEEIALALNLLYELAQSKNKIFSNEIIESLKAAGKEKTYTIPVSTIISSQSEVRAYTSSDSDKIIKEAISGVKLILKGGTENTTQGIGSLLGSFVNSVLGSGSGEEIEKGDYFVALDELAIVRLDVKIWIRKININGFSKELESVIAYTAVKSSVDVNAIQFSDFIAAYANQLETAKMTTEQKIEELKKMKELFELYSQGGTTPKLNINSREGAMKVITKMNNSSNEFLLGAEPTLSNLIGGKVQMRVPGSYFK